MKGAIAALLITIIIVISALLFIKPGSQAPKLNPGEDVIYGKPPIERTEPVKLNIVEALPAETNAMMVAPSMGQLISSFSITKDSILGFQLPDEYLEFCNEIGLNPLNLEELEAYGIDTKSEVGFFSTGLGFNAEKKTPSVSLTFCIPTTENSTLLDTIDAKLSSPSRTKTEKEQYTLYSDEDDEFAIALTQKENYLYLTLGTGIAKTEEEVQKLLSGKGKLSGSKRFNKAIQGLGNSGSLFCYMDLSQMIADSSFMELLRQSDETTSEEVLEYLNDLLTFYKGAALWVDFTGKDFVIRSVLEMNLKSKLSSMYSDNVVANPVFHGQKNPIVLFAQSFDISNLYKDFQKHLGADEVAELAALMDSVNREFGLPDGMDFIELFGGNYGLGFYDGKSIGLGTYNGLMSIAVTNEKDANIVRKAIHTRLEKELEDLDGIMNSAYIEETKIEGVPTSKLFIPMGGKFYLGVHNKQLILSSEKDLYIDAITGSYKKGFSKNISDKNLKYAIDTRTMAMSYLDMHEALDIVDNFAGTLSALSSLGSLFSSDKQGNPNRAQEFELGIKKLTKELRVIKYLLGYSQVDKEILTSEVRIATDFSGSFPEGVAQLVQNCIEIIKELD